MCSFALADAKKGPNPTQQHDQVDTWTSEGRFRRVFVLSLLWITSVDVFLFEIPSSLDDVVCVYFGIFYKTMGHFVFAFACLVTERIL